MEKEEKKTVKPVDNTPNIMEDPQATIQHLKEDLAKVYAAYEDATKENQILRAVIKGLTSML